MKILNTKNVNIIQTIFKNYWAMGNFDMQRAYLIKQSNRYPSEAEVKLGSDNPARRGYRSKYFCDL